jgi:hypothetical protein
MSPSLTGDSVMAEGNPDEVAVTGADAIGATPAEVLSSVTM